MLVKAANWLTHLDHDRETSSGGTGSRASPAPDAVRYDERGCGMSDWDVESFDFDDWVDDLELVVDAAGLDASRCSACRRARPSPSRSRPATPSG